MTGVEKVNKYGGAGIWMDARAATSLYAVLREEVELLLDRILSRALLQEHFYKLPSGAPMVPSPRFCVRREKLGLKVKFLRCTAIGVVDVLVAMMSGVYRGCMG